MKAFFLILPFLPFVVFSQVAVTGRVVDADNKPVPYASVFLSNTTGGTSTGADGDYTINNVKPGQYDLVVSFIGFETHHQNIAVSNSMVIVPAILLALKTNQLKEVTISARPDPNRERDLETFIREFLGQTPNAVGCKILNTDAIDIQFSASTRMLTASSDAFLVVENKALGYKIHYQLNRFTKDYGNNFVYYEGPVWFEEMKGRAGQQQRWLKNRLNVYQASSMHFLRCLFNDSFVEQGFKAMKLIRKPNPARPPDTLIRARLRKFAAGTQVHPDWHDSLSFWRSKMELPKLIEYLVSKPLQLADFVKTTDQKDLLAMQYPDFLYVFYTKKHDDTVIDHVYHPLDMPAYPTTVITLNAKYALFDRNGIFTDPSATTFDGAWGLSGVADMLPVNYEPPVH